MKELTLHYIPSKGRHRARVRVSYRPLEGAQPQEREVTFKFTTTAADRHLIQWYLEEYLLYPWGEFCTRAQRAELIMEQLGIKLFNAIFSDRETCALYAHVADDLANTRIVIHANTPESVAVPWELMRDSTRGEYGNLALLSHAFFRSQPDLIFQPSLIPSSNSTLNILMVVSRPGGPDTDVPFQSVARPLLELFRPHRDSIRLDILRPPTFEQLSRVLTEKPNFYHVLHFDGHGAFLQGTGTHGLLIFEGEDDKARRVTGMELGSLLAGKGVPIVLLNACQSGMTRPESLYLSVGNDLLKAGTSGVVAMAFSVYVQSAIRFMSRLYEALINGQELSRAVVLAREELRAHPQRLSPIGEIPLQDWIVPILFESAPVRIVTKPLGNLQLSPNLLQDQQVTAGQEIDCPELPGFGFVGRDGMILSLERAFQAETIVLLNGMAGIGKTDTAVGFARWRAETGGLNGPIFFFRFEHHIHLLQLCDRIGQVFRVTIRQQLGKEWQLLNPEQRRHIALTILRQVPCLMIWDNFENVAGFPTGTSSKWSPDEKKQLRDFLNDLRGGRTKVIITSRRDEPWVGNIYRRVEIGGLKLGEAQELALRVMRRAGLNQQQIKSLPQYNDLLRYLQGNPLAIQAILPELSRTKPSDLLQALQSGELNLNQDISMAGSERSLFASLVYCLDRLDETLRQRLGLLGMFQGYVNVGVLEAICQQIESAPDIVRGLGSKEWIQILENAVEVGLLRREFTGCYGIHPAVPSLFYNLMRRSFSDNLDWLESAYASIYGGTGYSLTQMYQTHSECGAFLLHAEENNLMRAFQLALNQKSWNDIKGILSGLHTLLITQGRWAEYERVLTTLESEISGSDGTPLEELEDIWQLVMGSRQEIAYYRGDLATQQNILHKMSTYADRTGNLRDHASVLNNLALVAQGQHRFDEAHHLCSLSLDIMKRVGDDHGQAEVLHNLGLIAQSRGHFKEAERWYKECLIIKEIIGDDNGQGQTLHNMGQVAQKRGRLDKAEQLFRRSLAIFERVCDKPKESTVLNSLGVLAQLRKNLEEAEGWYRKSLAISELVGDYDGQSSTLCHLGTIAEERGQLEEAERWHHRSLLLEERIGDKYSQASTLGRLGDLAKSNNRFQEAENLYGRALALFEYLDNVQMQAIIFDRLGTIAQEQNQLEKAEQWYLKALDAFKSVDNADAQATILDNLGSIAFHQKELEKAANFCRQGLAIAERINDKKGQATSLYNLGLSTHAQGDVVEAIRYFEHAEKLLIHLNDPELLNVVRTALQSCRGNKND